MYCLVFFYHTLRHDLADRNPLPKLMCIKAVVFFTFWWVHRASSLSPLALPAFFAYLCG